MKFDISLDEDVLIKVGAHDISVFFVEDDHKAIKTEEEDARPDHGEYNPLEYAIYIRKADPPSIRLSTFLHEMTHVFEHLYTFEVDHMVLNLISECYTQVLIDNFKDDSDHVEYLDNDE